jgi:hypothetical protein
MVSLSQVEITLVARNLPSVYWLCLENNRSHFAAGFNPTLDQRSRYLYRPSTRRLSSVQENDLAAKLVLSECEGTGATQSSQNKNTSKLSA